MYIIWHDNDYDFARWVYLNSDLSKQGEKVLLRPIPKTNKKSNLLDVFEEDTDFDILPVIKYETPDIILQYIDDKTKKSQILFVTEFMTHTPQHHHPLQRFSRIYGASKLKLPVALVLPNSKIKLERKNGKYVPTKYKTNPLIYHVFLRTTKVNKNPTLIFLWPEFEGYLKNDKKHPTAPFIDEQISRWFYFLNKVVKKNGISYNSDTEFKNQVQLMIKNSNYRDLKQSELIQKWDSLYKLETINIIPTKDIITKFKLDKKKLPSLFMKREFSLLFAPKGLHAPSTPFRTDPYAGMLCAFDNLFCRDENGLRTVNLVLRAENIKYYETSFEEIKHDKNGCPFLIENLSQKEDINKIKKHLDNCPYTKSKQQRIYGMVADIIIFDDKIVYQEE